MDGESSKIDILKLAQLLKPPEEPPSSPPDEFSSSSTSHLKPAPNANKQTELLEEFKKFKEPEESEDARSRPDYDIKYLQAVTAEDLFLRIGPKTPASACCEDMVLTVRLPEERASALELKLFAHSLRLTGRKHRLDLELPHSIDPDRSKAKWIGESETLVVTLRLVREFDFVNF